MCSAVHERCCELGEACHQDCPDRKVRRDDAICTRGVERLFELVQLRRGQTGRPYDRVDVAGRAPPHVLQCCSRDGEVHDHLGVRSFELCRVARDLDAVGLDPDQLSQVDSRELRVDRRYELHLGIFADGLAYGSAHPSAGTEDPDALHGFESPAPD
jgi:hypothetical protein